MQFFTYELGFSKKPNFSKNCPKSSHCSFYGIWASFARNSVADNFKKSPNLVTVETSFNETLGRPKMMWLCQLHPKMF